MEKLVAPHIFEAALEFRRKKILYYTVQYDVQYSFV